jgi:hypothetical protein
MYSDHKISTNSMNILIIYALLNASSEGLKILRRPIDDIMHAWQLDFYRYICYMRPSITQRRDMVQAFWLSSSNAQTPFVHAP